MSPNRDGLQREGLRCAAGLLAMYCQPKASQHPLASLPACKLPSLLPRVALLLQVARRLQAQGRPGFPRRYRGSMDCTVQMLRQEGPASFWRGSVSTALKIVPSIAATRWVEWVALLLWVPGAWSALQLGLLGLLWLRSSARRGKLHQASVAGGVQ